MRDLRLALEDKILKLEQIDTKKMFGCPCYQANGKLFVFLVTKGIVITQLDNKDMENISQQFSVTSFKAGKKTIKSWARVPIESEKDLNTIMPFIEKSYKRALKANNL